jgi:hypothetical protein
VPAGPLAQLVLVEAIKAGLGFIALSNGFASCDDPAGAELVLSDVERQTLRSLSVERSRRRL